jgi:hypothetical protein
MSPGDLDLTPVLIGIRRGSTVAEEQLASLYSDGIRSYLKRRLGPEDLEDRVRQLLATMVERVRKGWNPQPANVVLFLREAVEVWRTGESAPHPGTEQRSEQAGLSPSHASIQAKAKLLEKAIHGCSKREMEMLIRYYVHGQDTQQVLDSMGATEEEFTKLKWRLRRLATAEMRGLRPKTRAAAAG